MRIIVVVFTALLTLGLVTFGVVVAQKATDPVPLTAAAARVSSSQNAESAKSDKAPLHMGEAVKAAAPFAPTAVAQKNTMTVAPAFPASALAPRPFAACNNPDALGLSRVIEIDTAGGPAFGTEHFKQYDFLRDKEVALTFDDGPWPGNTPMVRTRFQNGCTEFVRISHGPGGAAVSENSRTCSAVIASWQGRHSNVCISRKLPFDGSVRKKRIRAPQLGHAIKRSVSG